MKHIILGFSILLKTLMLIGCGEAAANVDIGERIKSEEVPVLTWGVKADTNLFGFYNIQTGKIEGFDIDIASALTDEMTNGKGIAEFVEVTSKTRIPLLKTGKIDGILATMTITEEREQQVDFSDVLLRSYSNVLI